MTLLVGKSNIAGSGASGIPPDTATYFKDGFVASQSGSATALYFYVDNAPTATAFKIGLFNSSGVLLAETAGITSWSDGAWASAAITPTAITSGTTYLLAILANGTIRGRATSDAPAGYFLSRDATTFPTFPTLTPGGDDNLDQWAVYADGTPGGSSLPPKMMQY